MKEIGIEKLIDLLNEYEKDKIKDSEGLDVMYIWKYEGILHYYNNYKDENIFDNVRFLIISKYYGFIKWLVDNDKIEREKLERRPFSDSLVYSDSDCTVRRSDTTYEMLLMLLSIQDNPIEFLISILK